MSAALCKLPEEFAPDVPLTEPVLVWTADTGWRWCDTPEQVMAAIGNNDLRVSFQLTIEERDFNCRLLRDY